MICEYWLDSGAVKQLERRFDLHFSYKTRMKKMLEDDEDLDIERYHSDEIADASMLSVTS